MTKTEFLPLFDGTSIEKWRMCGPGQFVLDRQEGLIRSEGGMGLFWYAPRMFQNFVLQLEWRTVRRDDNSGVFIRFPNPGDDPWVAVNEGYEIQIYDEEWEDARQVTGAIYNMAAAIRVASHQTGEWNLFEITADGPAISVRLNGEIVVPPYRGERRADGFVGVQNHDELSCVSFRNIRIREL